MALSCGDVGRAGSYPRYGGGSGGIAAGSFSKLAVVVVSPAFDGSVRQYRTSEPFAGGNFGDAGREPHDVYRNGPVRCSSVSKLSAVVHAPAFDSAGERYRAAEIRSVRNLYRFEKVVDDDQGIGLFRDFSGIGSRNFERRSRVERGGDS